MRRKGIRVVGLALSAVAGALAVTHWMTAPGEPGSPVFANQIRKAFYMAKFGYLQFDRAGGQQLYLQYCSHCHGQDGEGKQAPGLRESALLDPRSVRKLYGVINRGIAGTEMPAFWFQLTERETWQIVGHLRSLETAPQAPAGDAVRGAEIFRTRGNCLQCHAVGAEGSDQGPNLSRIGRRRSPAYLLEALVTPDSSIPDGYAAISVVTNTRKTIQGFLSREDTFSLQIRDRSGDLHSVWKAELAAMERFERSLMPSYQGSMTVQDREDVVAYLVSLKE